MENKVATIVNEKLQAALAAGVVPWKKPWRVRGIRNQNLVTGHEYRGINAVLTALSGFASPYWLTFKQCAARGGKVKQGEHGTIVTFWTFLESKTEKAKDGKPKKFPFLRYYTIFNVLQCEGIEAPSAAEDINTGYRPEGDAQDIMMAYLEREKIRLFRGGNRAFYNMVEDSIALPDPEQFAGAEGYWNTAFHEAAHSTGVEPRLKRDTLLDRTEKNRAREELVAEIAACYLCNESGVEPDFGNSAAYIANWSNAVGEDPMLFITAASRAEAAAEYVLGDKVDAAEVTEAAEPALA
jgi:antirestriction protein ArdC